MQLILTVFEIVAPVFGLAVIGFAWVRLGFEYRIQFVTRLAMSLAVPALIFTALMRTDIDAAALGEMSLAAGLAYLGVAAFAFVGVRLARLEIRTYLAPLIFGNTGNLGLPLALFAFGDEGLALAVIVFAIMAILAFTVGVWLVSGAGSLAGVLREPVVLATLAGAVFLWQGWQTPVFVTNTLELIAQLAIPLMLITLGVAVARLKPGRVGRAVWLSLAKVALSVAVAWAVGSWLGLAPVARAVLVLQVSTPVAVTSYLLAEKYEAEPETVAGLVVVSTLMSMAVLPMLLGFLI